MHDEDFVLRIAFLDKSHGRCEGLRLLGRHAKTLVNENSYCHRNVFSGEHGDRLLMAVFEDTEIFFCKTGNEPARAILDAYVQQHERHIAANGEITICSNHPNRYT